MQNLQSLFINYWISVVSQKEKNAYALANTYGNHNIKIIFFR